MSFVELFGETLVGRDGQVKTEEALADKSFVMVYFSAHWCPPCRGFTPKLAEKYNEFAKSAKVEIVFVSSDQDEESFKEYYNDMPWLALPFDCTEKETNLSTIFSVQGIPTLVVLDGAGKLVTKNGRGELDNFLGTPRADEAPESIVDLVGDALVGNNSAVQTAAALESKKYIMLYFSAHWCPPCRGFTPQLAEAYSKHKDSGSFEIIFISSDRDESSWQEYFQEMPWLALPFSDKDTKAKLSKKYEIRGIPSLVVLDAAGNLLTTSGRAEYMKYMGDEVGTDQDSEKVLVTPRYEPNAVGVSGFSAEERLSLLGTDVQKCTVGV